MEVLVGLGSNVDAATNIPAAILRVRELGRIVTSSRRWDTPRVGPGRGAPFVNQVVWLETALDVASLAKKLRAIEGNLGRRRGGDKYADRTIDLDLLASRLDWHGWTVHAAHLAEEPFHLIGLHDLVPRLVVPPTGETVADLLHRRPFSAHAQIEVVPTTAAARAAGADGHVTMAETPA